MTTLTVRPAPERTTAARRLSSGTFRPSTCAVAATASECVITSHTGQTNSRFKLGITI